MEEAMQVKPFAFKRRFERVDWRRLGKKILAQSIINFSLAMF